LSTRERVNSAVVGENCLAEDNCASIRSNLVRILNYLGTIRIRQSTAGRCFRCNVVENHPSQLNKIVVTSQRRSENLQTIPLSVTAATATELLN
jgi:F420-dependent methylenetetrahydromethanopterin dehydrogenase